MASREKEMTERKTAETTAYRFFLNGEPSERISREALDKMADRLSRVVSQHFREHPDEYERFLKSQKNHCPKTAI